MESSLYLLILLIEWIMLITIAAPVFFAGRFRKKPTLGIFVWLTSIASSIVATLWALVIATGFIFESYFRLREGDEIGSVLILSFAPWLLLGFAGVLLALANQRLSSLFVVSAGPLDSLLGGRVVQKFRTAEVIELSLPGYFALSKGRAIYLSKAVFELAAKQYEAVLQHEYGHIVLRHGLIKKFSHLIYQLMPWVVASRAMKNEVDFLCEVAADNYALRRVMNKDLRAARKLFV